MAGETGPRNMAVVDIVRDRERGMVRYNQARRQYGLRPLADFEDINGRDNSPEGRKARCQTFATFFFYTLIDDISRRTSLATDR